MNLVLAAILAAFALTAWLLLPKTAPPSEPRDDAPLTESTVIISVGGEEKMRVPLSRPQTVTVTQPGGEENVIVVTENGAYMASSTCHNQICVHSGHVTIDNCDYRPDGPFIICLPNRVTLELVVLAQNDAN